MNNNNKRSAPGDSDDQVHECCRGRSSNNIQGQKQNKTKTKTKKNKNKKIILGV